jgi:hypothetical protein
MPERLVGVASGVTFARALRRLLIGTVSRNPNAKSGHIVQMKYAIAARSAWLFFQNIVL